MRKLDSFTYLSVLGVIASVSAFMLGIAWAALSGNNYGDGAPLFVMVGFGGMLISFPCALVGSAWSLARRQEARSWNLAISIIAGAGSFLLYYSMGRH